METFYTLYKKDSKGNIREWRMEQDDNCYRTVAGLQNGGQVISGWTIAEPKNVGKKNATTGAEQARAEVHAHYTKKLDIDYYNCIQDVDTPKVFLPMLADTGLWTDSINPKDGKFIKGNRHRVKYDQPVYFQPKLDGIRCIATRHGMFSRKGKKIVSCPHIMEDLQPLFDMNPDAILDGELYNHVLKEDFEEIVSMVKRAKCKPEDIAKTAELVQFHVYDYPTLRDENFIDRYNGLVVALRDCGISGKNDVSIRLTPTYLVKSEADIDDWYNVVVDQGYEGGIVRLNTPYLLKRTTNLLKMKPFEDAEFIIVRIEEGTGNWKGCAKKLIFTNNMQHEGVYEDTGAGMTGTKSEMKEVFENRDAYVGKEATIKFCGRTKNLKPRIATTKALHLTPRI